MVLKVIEINLSEKEKKEFELSVNSVKELYNAAKKSTHLSNKDILLIL